MMAKRLLLLCENPKADCMMAKGLLLLYDVQQSLGCCMMAKGLLLWCDDPKADYGKCCYKAFSAE